MWLGSLAADCEPGDRRAGWEILDLPVELPLDAQVDLEVHELKIFDCCLCAQRGRHFPCQDLVGAGDEAQAAFGCEGQGTQQVTILAFVSVQDGGHLLTVREDTAEGAFEHVEQPYAGAVLEKDVPEQRGQEGALALQGQPCPVL